MLPELLGTQLAMGEDEDGMLEDILAAARCESVESRLVLRLEPTKGEDKQEE